MNKNLIRILCTTFTITAVGLTSGCMKTPDSAKNGDPFEAYNRVMFAFNQDVDHLTLRPAAQLYSKITPNFVQKGVGNALDNLDELNTLPNDILQGNFKYVAVDFWRFLINSTLGLGGLFDVAKHMGIKKHVETFGLTLAKWRGGKTSPYFILPFFGSRTIQTSLGLGFHYFTSPWPYINNKTATYAVLGLYFLDARTKLLPADKLVKNAFDPYVFVRDAYMQRQRHRIAKNEALGEKPTEDEYVDDTDYISGASSSEPDTVVQEAPVSNNKPVVSNEHQSAEHAKEQVSSTEGKQG